MNRLILLPIILIGLGITPALAQESPGGDFVFDWCVGEVYADHANWKCSWTDWFTTPLDLEEAISFDTQEDSPAETFAKMQITVGDLIQPEDEAPQTEAQKLGITEESLQRLEEKAIEQGLRDEVYDECVSGEEQAAAFQSRRAIEDIEKKLDSIEDWENLTTADWKYIMECRAFGMTKNWANAAYATMDVTHPKGFKALSTEHLRTGIFATDETKQQAHDDAVEYIKGISYLKSMVEEPFASLRDPTATYQRDEAAIRHAEAEAERQQIKADADTLTENCNMAWDMIGKGATTPEWWPRILVDGTCDDEIDELVELRGDYIREQWENQTPENCPDCKRFQ